MNVDALPAGVTAEWLEFTLAFAFSEIIKPEINVAIREMGGLFRPEVSRLIVDDKFASDPQWLRDKLYDFAMTRLTPSRGT